jgi:hypothetical protein
MAELPALAILVLMPELRPQEEVREPWMKMPPPKPQPLESSVTS